MSGSLARFDAVLHPLETTLYIVADHKAPNRFLGFPASAHPLNKFLPLEEITEDEFHREFNINVLGTLLATKEAVKYFGPNGGSVINMSSIASAGEANAPIYSGTKGAVDAIIEHPSPRRRAFRVWRRAGMGILQYWCLTVY